MAKTYDLLFKLVLVGYSGVGNTCILKRFCEDTFHSTLIATIGVDFKMKTVEIEGKKIKLQIWDTAGQERFREITTTYMRTAMGMIITYDITDKRSFQDIRNWISDIAKHAPADVEKMILGNKCDLQERRVVSMERGRLLAEELGVKFMEVSAKFGVNIEEAFLTLARDIKKKVDRRVGVNRCNLMQCCHDILHFRLFIAEAGDLLKADTFGLSDPYVKVSFVNATVANPKKEYKTSTIRKTLNPKWNEELDFWGVSRNFSVILDVMNENKLFKDEFLGRQILHFSFGDQDPGTYPLVITHHLPHSRDLLLEGRKCQLTLLDMYSPDLTQSHTHLVHVRDLSKRFTTERQTHHHSHKDNRGNITVYYVFENLPKPSSSDADGARPLGFGSLLPPSAPPPSSLPPVMRKSNSDGEEDPSSLPPPMRESNSDGEEDPSSLPPTMGESVSNKEEGLLTGWEQSVEEQKLRSADGPHAASEIGFPDGEESSPPVPTVMPDERFSPPESLPAGDEETMLVLQGKCTTLDLQLEREKHKNQCIQEHSEQLIQEKENIATENLQLQQQLAQERRDAIRARQQLQQQASEIQHLQQRLSSASSDNQQLQQQLDWERKEAIQIKQQLELRQASEIQQLQQRLRSASSDNQQLQQQLIMERKEAIQTKQELEQRQESEIQQFQQRLSIAITDNQHLQQRLSSASADLQNLQDIEPWKISRNKVEIQAGISVGGWGSVSEGTVRVAVKTLHELLLSHRNIDRVQREMRMLAQVRHPNLVQFIGVVFDESALRLQASPMIITELLEMNLRTAYERELGFNKLTIFQDVARALNYLHNRHEPIIHRDISAPNVLLEALPNRAWKAKVSDLGSANLAKLAHTLGEGAIIYAAPETMPHQARNPQAPKLPQTTKVDVYCFGVLLCEVGTSRFPDPDHYEDMLEQVQREWPSLHDLIISCTRYNPDERPTMAEVHARLSHSSH